MPDYTKRGGAGQIGRRLNGRYGTVNAETFDIPVVYADFTDTRV